MSKTEKTSLVAFIVLVGCFVGAAVAYIRVSYLGMDPAYGGFLFTPEDKFNDLFNLLDPVRRWEPYSNRLSVYFPFAFAFLYPFSLLPEPMALSVFVAVFTGFLFNWVFEAVRMDGGIEDWRKTFTIAFLAQPALYVLDRANIEAFVFVFLALFIHFRRRGNAVGMVLSLAVASAMKLYPAFFGVLLLRDRRYREAATAALLAVALTAVPFLTFHGGPTMNLAAFRFIQEVHHRIYVIGPDGQHYSSSLYPVIKFLLFHPWALGLSATEAARWTLLRFYVIGALPIVAAIAWFVWRRVRDDWMAVAWLTLAVILLPEQSHDYKLIHLLIPLALYLDADGLTARRDRVFSALFAALLIPKQFFYVPGFSGISTFLNPALILGFMSALLYWGAMSTPAAPGVPASSPRGA